MGPLAGTTVIELKGIGPGPYAGMLLADMGADVIVIERAKSTPGIGIPAKLDICSRGKQSIALNLKTPDGIETLLRLVEKADMLIEGFRPGVVERLGCGPTECHARNPRLVYGRVTGWGQTGPLANVAGHDINFIALSGALAAIGAHQQPTIPLNLLGDYAGGSLFLVIGMLAALTAATKTGSGDVIDAAITDGTASLMTIVHSLSNLGAWQPKRSSNMLDGAAHFYNVYETADGKHVSIGAIEPQFYEQLMNRAQLDTTEFANQFDQADWPSRKAALTNVFKTKTRDEWCDLLEGSDACFAPVLNFKEAPKHAHHRSRDTYITIDGIEQPAPAPRFSHHAPMAPTSAHDEGADTEQVLAAYGFSATEIHRLTEIGAIPKRS